MSKYIVFLALFINSYTYAGKIWLGFVIEEKQQSLFITRVIPNSPADKGGLRPQDEILEVGQKTTKSLDQFFKELKTKSSKDIISISIKRKNKTLTQKITPINSPSELEKLNIMFKKEIFPNVKLTPILNSESEINLHEIKNKKIIMFWATWCTYCHAALKRISEFSKEQKKSFLFISDESLSQLKKHLLKHKFNTDQFYQIKDNSDFYLVNALPTLFKINKEKVVEEISIGFGSSFNRLISE